MKKVGLFAITVACMLILACGKSSSGPSEPTAVELCNSGWSAYDDASFVEAVSYFGDAIEKDSELYEAYTGRGWSYIRNDQFTEAKADFATAIADADYTDYRAVVGLGSIHVMENNGSGAVVVLSRHVDIPDAWFHDHDSEITAIDLHNLLAEGYIMTGVEGDETTSAVNALDAWGQVKKSLDMDATDAKALELQSYLRGE